MKRARSIAPRGRAAGWLAAMFICGALGAGEASGASTVTYQKGDGKGAASETDDAYIREPDPNTNYGTLTICVADQTSHYHCVVKFPNIFGNGANQISLGSTILSATLTMNVVDPGVVDPTVYQLTEAWAESQVTWNSRLTAVSWTDPGADGPVSHKPVAEGDFPSTVAGFSSLDVTASVRRWSNGESNEGWVFVNGPDDNGIDYASSEDATVTNRPRLTVTYVPETPCAGANQLWWNADWGRRRKIRFDNKAQTQNLDNFPVLIRLDSTRVDYTRTQNLGQDTRFVDADSNTVLAHEIEFWNETGSSYVWVRVPRINGSSSTDFIWMYYDNGTVGDGQNATAVWDASHRAVWHLKESPAAAPPQFLDSTSNPNDGTAAATPPLQVAGQIHFGLGFTAATDRHVAVTDHASLQLGTSMTVSAWIRTTTPADVSNRVVVTRWGTSPNRNYWLGKTGASLSFFVDDTQSVSTPLVPFNDGAWHHLVGVADAPNNLLRIYVDGVQRNTAAYTGTSRIGVSSIFLGANPDIGNQDWDGDVDETRVESAARSADWIRAQRLSMSDTFASFGPELGSCNVRSIGTRGNYGTVGPEGGTTTVSVTQGSRVVSGSVGTTWLSSNRGRGDRININGVDYTVFWVDSNSQLRLTSVYRGVDASGLTYSISRQYLNLAAWEDCVDGPPGVACPFFPVATASLAVDNRGEVGVAYKDTVFNPAARVDFVGATTDTAHTITLTADGTNRHNGVEGAGVVIDGMGAYKGFWIEDNNYTIEWLEFKNIYGVNDRASISIRSGTASQTGILLQNLLIHDFNDGTANVIKGIGVQGGGGKFATIRNVMIWNGDQKGIEGDAVNDNLTIENCTVHGMANYGIDAFHSQFIVRNTISTGNPSGDFVVIQADGTMSGSNNTSSDPTVATGPRVTFTSTQPSVAASTLYLDFTGPVLDLHLQPTAVAVNTGLDLSPSFASDIDGQLRPAGAGWDRGADESAGTTAVTLQSFEASPLDSAVDLAWQTASELDNLGFHLYRSLSETGPWDRITPSLIPGLGSSPIGRATRGGTRVW